MSDLTAARERHVKGAIPALCHHDPLNWPCDFALAIEALDEAENALNGCIDRYSRTITAAADVQADLNNARALADELARALRYEVSLHPYEADVPDMVRAALAKWEASK